MSSDLAGRYVDLVVRLLPEARNGWGQAMRAELAALEDASERRRFAFSCTRVVFAPTAGSGFGAAALVLVAAVALAGIIGPTIPAIATLTALAWLGRRPGALGPARPGRLPRAVRAGGFALPCAFLFIDALQGGASGLLQADHHGRFVTVLLASLAAAFLAVSADGSRLSDDVLSSGAIAGLASGAAAFALLPFAQNAAPLADRLPGDGSWLALIVVGAPAGAALFAGRRMGSVHAGLEAALCSATFAVLVVALFGLGAVALFPGQIPHFAGQIMMPGTSAAARQAEDAIAASDQYEVLLVFGTLLAASLWAVARSPGRPRETRAARSS